MGSPFFLFRCWAGQVCLPSWQLPCLGPSSSPLQSSDYSLQTLLEMMLHVGRITGRCKVNSVSQSSQTRGIGWHDIAPEDDAGLGVEGEGRAEHT